MACVRERGATVVAQVRGTQCGTHAQARHTAGTHGAAAATRVGAEVRASAPPLTARQRAEREETARRKQWEEAAARVVLLQRRVLADIRARDEAIAPASASCGPLTAVELARAEAARRGGPAQAIAYWRRRQCQRTRAARGS